MRRFLSIALLFLLMVPLAACKSGATPDDASFGPTEPLGPVVAYSDGNQTLTLLGHRVWREEGSDVNYYVFRFRHEGDGEIGIYQVFIGGTAIGLNEAQTGFITGDCVFDYVVTDDCLEVKWLVGYRAEITESTVFDISFKIRDDASSDVRYSTVSVSANMDVLVASEASMLEDSSAYDVEF